MLDRLLTKIYDKIYYQIYDKIYESYLELLPNPKKVNYSELLPEVVRLKKDSFIFSKSFIFVNIDSLAGYAIRNLGHSKRLDGINANLLIVIEGTTYMYMSYSESIKTYKTFLRKKFPSQTYYFTKHRKDIVENTSY